VNEVINTGHAASVPGNTCRVGTSANMKTLVAQSVSWRCRVAPASAEDRSTKAPRRPAQITSSHPIVKACGHFHHAARRGLRADRFSVPGSAAPAIYQPLPVTAC
jgi:hypothetical protein